MNLKMDNEKKVLAEWEDGEAVLDKKTAKRLVWRTRLSIIFTVIRTLLAIFLLYTVYMIAMLMFYNFSGKEAAFDRFVTTVIETRYPGISVDKSSLQNTQITPFLTQKTNLTLYSQVGDWEAVLGDVAAKKTLFGKLELDINFDKKYLNDTIHDVYALPSDLLGKEEKATQEEPWVAEQLRNISDGYVAQLQFSTRESMEPEELLEILEAYDVNVLEMPVHAGELTGAVEDVGYESAGNILFISPLKLRPGVEYDKKNLLSVTYSSLSGAGGLEEALKQLPKDLEWLVEHGGYYEAEYDRQRLEYIKENPIRVFGAIVTGPIREIEKLAEDERFHQFHIGGIEVWNWDAY